MIVPNVVPRPASTKYGSCCFVASSAASFASTFAIGSSNKHALHSLLASNLPVTVSATHPSQPVRHAKAFGAAGEWTARGQRADMYKRGRHAAEGFYRTPREPTAASSERTVHKMTRMVTNETQTGARTTRTDVAANHILARHEDGARSDRAAAMTVAIVRLIAAVAAVSMGGASPWHRERKHTCQQIASARVVHKLQCAYEAGVDGRTVAHIVALTAEEGPPSPVARPGPTQVVGRAARSRAHALSGEAATPFLPRSRCRWNLRHQRACTFS